MSVLLITESLNINEVIKATCLEALNNSFSITQAARKLGISARTVHNYIKRFNIVYCYTQNKYITSK
jgi:molybdate transport repressor ModE-like protein